MLERLIACLVVFFCLNAPVRADVPPSMTREIGQSAHRIWPEVLKKKLNYGGWNFGTYTFNQVERAFNFTYDLKSVCLYDNRDDCTVLGYRWSLWNRTDVVMFFWKQETADALRNEAAAIIPGIALVKVDKAAFDAMMAKTEATGYRYNIGDNADVDEKWVMCGFAQAGCTTSIFLADPISAFLGCMASAAACSYAARATRRFQDQVNSGEVPKPEQNERPLGGGGGGEGGGGAGGSSIGPADGNPSGVGKLDCRTNYTGEHGGTMYKEFRCIPITS